MPNQSQQNKPSKLNQDKAKKYLSETEASYLLNHDILQVAGKSVPLPANSPICEIEQPDGDNFAIGTYYSELTNETYSWVYNSNGVHYISRINGKAECEIVYSGDCLPLSANPANGIFQWRAILRLEKICHNRHGKSLVWVDGTDNDIFCLDVEASIATNSFTTPFFDRCPDECAPLKLCVPQHCGCIKGEFAPLPDDQALLTNHLLDVGVKIIVQEEYYDLRQSEWSIPSTLFYQDIKGGCFGGQQGFSRCLKLTIPLGNPLVDKIKIGYSTDNGLTWLLSDTVDKYASYTSSTQYWYERDLNPELELTPDGCSFYYYFCNDKQCETIDPADVARVYNPIPHEPQGLIEIKDSYGVYNYKQGTCPIDRIQTDKFKLSLNCENQADCVTDYATVKVRAIIHNLRDNTNEFIYRNEGDYNRYGSPDDDKDPALFGGFERIVSYPFNATFEQKFPAKKRNFTVYVEGTSYSLQMNQFRAYEGFTKNTKVGIISGLENGTARSDVAAITSSGFYYYQEGELKVPKGTKGFLRLTPDGDHNSSTYVFGTIDNIAQYKSTNVLPNGNQEKEIYFDTCTGDVDLTRAFIINDNAEESNSKAAHGTIIDNSGAPLVGVDLYTSDDFYLGRTDHNGFYHFTLSDAPDSLAVKVVMEVDCATFGSVGTSTITLAQGTNVVKDIRVLNDDYVSKWYASAAVHVVDCNGDDVAGIPVAVSGAKFRYTDENGFALIPVRNYPDRARQVRAVVMDSGGCFLLDCNGDCNPCVASEVVQAPACFDLAVHGFAKTVSFTDIKLNTQQKSITNKGLKKGGRYGFGIVAEGDCGRISSVYPLKNGFLNIPKFQENQSEDFCKFNYDANGIILPDWVKCLHIVRTENLNPIELQWLVDDIERTGDGKVVLTIQSLNDYNEKYNFKTNTVYQYQQGDRIEIIQNGDGKIFPIADFGILNYATLSPFNNEELSGKTDADFFNQLIISDDGKLNTLVAGAKIELQRDKLCTTEPAYYSICQSLAVENGQVVNTTGTFETFDTYRVNRTIGNFPTQSFEHFAPSDFWVGKADDKGKAYFVNKYENERRYGRNVSLNSPTVINRFGDTVKTIGAALQGDIIALWISDARAVLGICENDTFVLSVADDLVRVSPNGEIVAVPADRIIGDPQIQLGGQFGCRYEDAGSVYFGEGYALWADVKRDAYVKHDYNSAKDVSEGQMKTYFKNKFRTLQVFNENQEDNLQKIRFATGANKFNGAVHLTIKALKHSFINNERGALVKTNETLVFYPNTNDFLTFASFTPEAYTVLNISDDEGCAFITYKNGVPYLHPIVATKWNEFYGEAVDRVVTIAINKFPEKIKVALSVEVQDETMWFISSVKNDNPNFLSEIPPVRFKKTENKWSASFLGNANSRKGLFSNEQPRGYFCSVTLVRDNTVGNIYNSVDNAKRIKFDELDLLITKFMLSEQSGMTENL